MDVLMRSRSAHAVSLGPMRARIVAAALSLALAADASSVAARARATADVRLGAIEPATLDSMLVCHVATEGLPDARSTDTLLSGLPSALVFAFTILDASGRERGTLQTEVRIEPDLWEGILVVRSPLRNERAKTIEDVASILSNLGPLPVAPLRFLDRETAARVRVRLAVFPLAPGELERVHSVLAGEETGEDDRQEVSVGLGALVRYFLGRSPEEEWLASGQSGFFRLSALPEVR
jgi:hypothetical protein